MITRRMIGVGMGRLALVLGALLAFTAGFVGGGGTAAAAGPLVVDGDFEANVSSGKLRSKEKPQGWYESRRDGAEGRRNLMLSTKKVYGNATKKSVVKADPKVNTYLSQRLGADQKGRFTLKYDIAVKEILPPFNRSAFQILGNAFVSGRGPNASGAERFVFLGFENAAAPGKVNLFAFEGKTDSWDAKTIVARDLDLKKWYTVILDVDVAAASYTVMVPGVTAAPVEVGAFRSKGKSPKVITHLSFASWNDGPGTFYIDNVGQP